MGRETETRIFFDLAGYFDTFPSSNLYVRIEPPSLRRLRINGCSFITPSSPNLPIPSSPIRKEREEDEPDSQTWSNRRKSPGRRRTNPCTFLYVFSRAAIGEIAATSLISLGGVARSWHAPTNGYPLPSILSCLPESFPK